MATAYFLCPYQARQLPSGRTARVCVMDDHTPEIEAAGGAWAESEIDGDRAVVRVRATDTLLSQLQLRFPALSETGALAATKLARRVPLRIDSDTLRVDFSMQTVPAKPLDVLVREIPDTPPSQEFLTLLGLWMAVGFGEGWRLPLSEIIKGALSGLPPLWGAAFPTTTILDTFNRANEGPPPSASWGNSWLGNGFKVVSNQCRVHVDDADNGSYWSAATFGPDCEVYNTIASIPASSWFGYHEIQARLANPTSSTAVDGYAVSIENEARGVPKNSNYYRIDNGVYTQLGATYTGHTWSNGHRQGFELIGSTLQYYLNTGTGWTTLTTSRTDTTYAAAGSLALGGSRATTLIDDFGGGTVVTDGATFAAALEGSGVIAPALTTQITVSSSLEGAAVVQSALTSLITLASLLEGSGVMTPALTTEITAQTALEASASVTAALTSAAAGATFATALEGSGTVGSSLTTEIACAAALDGAATLQSAITTDMLLASSLEASAALQAAITTEIVTAAVLAASGDLAAALRTEIVVATALAGSAEMLSDLTVVAPLRVTLDAAGAMQAALTTQVLLAGGLDVDLALASALLTTIELQAGATAEAQVAAALTTAIRLATVALAEGLLTADLRTGEPLLQLVLADVRFARTVISEQRFARTVGTEQRFAGTVPREVEF